MPFRFEFFDHARFLDAYRIKLWRQPIVAVAGTRVGWEVLARIELPDGTHKSAGEIIAVMEQYGGIQWLDRAVLCHVIEYQNNHPEDRDVYHVNLSSETINRNGTLLKLFSALEQEYPIDRDRIILEITERTRVDRLAGIRTLRELKFRGYQLCLDDFGVGHSIVDLEWGDRLKIDGHFIRRLTDHLVQQDVRCIVTAAINHGMKSIIAECVETETQYETAREAGCTEFQGWHFGQGELLPR